MVAIMSLVALITAGDANAARGWTCTAVGYEPGYGATPGRRRTVHGREMGLQVDAELDALRTCMSSGLAMCTAGSCMRLPYAAE